MKERKKIALVLGGGSALGFAHIGVIKVLEEYGVPIDIVVGTSMGGLVGASYSAGLSVEEMTEHATKFKTIHFVDINFAGDGIFAGTGVMRAINKFLPDEKIESLNKAFACVAVDLMNEKEVVFRTGKLRDAVRATLSIPGFFNTHKADDKLLVDGGVLNNLPEDVAMEMGADIIISCDVLEDYRLIKKPDGAIDVLMAALNCLTKEVVKYKSHHADVKITPNLSEFKQMYFSKDTTLKIIEKGQEACEKEIKNILSLIKKR